MLPETLKKMNMFAGDQSFLGICEEVTLPKLEKNLADYRGAGMLGPVKIDQGYNELMLGMKVREMNPHLLRMLGEVDLAGTGLRFAGAMRSDEPNAPVTAIEVAVRGRLGSLDLGTANETNPTEVNVEFPLSYFKFVRNNETLIELDFVNMVEKIGGVDKMRDYRAALNI